MNNLFQITAWDETAYLENEDGSKKSHANITQTYSGLIEGSSELQYLMSYQNTASALFVGFELITGKINGKAGTVTLQHNGKFENGVASSRFTIVSGSGTADLAGLEGEGSFISGEAGQASYQLNIHP